MRYVYLIQHSARRSADALEGFSSAGRQRWRHCWIGVAVCLLHPGLDTSWTDSRCRFCIAPLDVLKIRLQLQVHSLSDPITDQGPVRYARYSTIETFKAILKNEGVTVCIGSVHVGRCKGLKLVLGILERQHPCRAPLHILRRYPIFRLPPSYPVASALPSVR